MEPEDHGSQDIGSGVQTESSFSGPSSPADKGVGWGWWRKRPVYVPTPEEVIRTIDDDLSPPTDVSMAMARGYPEVTLKHYAPILLDPSGEYRQRSLALKAVVILAEVQHPEARDVLISLLQDSDIQWSGTARWHLARCYGHQAEVQPLLRELPSYAALLGDAAAARAVKESRSTGEEERNMLEAVLAQDTHKVGGVLIKAQADSVRSQTAVNSQPYLLAAVVMLGCKEVVPYLRQYIQREKEAVKAKKGFDDYDWEKAWDPLGFVRNSRLYEAVRVLHVLGGELTDMEREYLWRVGMIGDAKQTIAKEDLNTGRDK